VTGAALIAGATAAAGVGGMAWAVRGRSSSVFGPNLWRGPEHERAMALTFDDGPSESTPALLEILAEHNARATFFQIGANVRRLPRIARAVVEAGHEVGNHSDSHPLFCFRSQAFLRADLTAAQQTIEAAAGAQPALYRAPFGVRWFGLSGVLHDLGLTGVMWTTIGRDWKCGGAEVAARLRQGFAHGSILCLHDGRELRVQPDISATIDATRRLLTAAAARGYRITTVSGLLHPPNLAIG
jgi:peptidoglycan/xylan/chitin deacetylase (PgdA/CDA1 family)